MSANDLYKVKRNNTEYTVAQLIENISGLVVTFPAASLSNFKASDGSTITGNINMCKPNIEDDPSTSQDESSYDFDYINGEVETLPEFKDSTTYSFIKPGLLVTHYCGPVPTHNIINSSGYAPNGDHELSTCAHMPAGTYYLAMKDATTLGLYTDSSCTTVAKWHAGESDEKTCEWGSSYFTRGIIPDRIGLTMVSGGGGGGAANVFSEGVKYMFSGGGGGGGGAAACIILNIKNLKQSPYKNQYKYKIVIGAGGTGGTLELNKSGTAATIVKSISGGSSGGHSEIYWCNSSYSSDPVLMLQLTGGGGGEYGTGVTSTSILGKGGSGGEMKLGTIHPNAAAGTGLRGFWWWEYAYKTDNWTKDGRAYFDKNYQMAGDGGNGSSTIGSRGGGGGGTKYSYQVSTIYEETPNIVKTKSDYYIYMSKKEGGVSSWGTDSNLWTGGGGGASVVRNGQAPTATSGAGDDPNYVYAGFGNGGGGGGYQNFDDYASGYLNGKSGGAGALWLYY